jgi:hypothetical protein
MEEKVVREIVGVVERELSNKLKAVVRVAL